MNERRFSRHGSPIAGILPLGASVLLAIGSAAAAASNADRCVVICASGPCSLVQPPSEDPRPLRSRGPVEQCSKQQVKDGTVSVGYMHKRAWFESPFLLKPGQNFSEVLTRFPPDTSCPVPDGVCVQQRMGRRRAPPGGHGIDGQVSTPAGTGEPCTIGLPCGRIVPPTEVPWRFQLSDGSTRGRWALRLLRGTPPAGAPAQIEVEVIDGRVELDPALLSAGASYAYRLSFADGSTRATGEFSLLGRTQLDALRGMVAQRVAAGRPEDAAWIDALVANELDWDAMQRLSVPR